MFYVLGHLFIEVLLNIHLLLFIDFRELSLPHLKFSLC